MKKSGVSVSFVDSDEYSAVHDVPNEDSARDGSARDGSARDDFTLQSSKQAYHALKGERGSISPLVTIYFLITLLVIFIGINVTHTYLERRHLVFALEAALQRATQEIDDFRYYTGYVERNTVSFGSRGQITFLPIDCDRAREIFREELKLQWQLTLQGNLADKGIAGDRELRNEALSDLPNSDGGGPSHLNSTSSLTSTKSSNPRVTAFVCDAKTIKATAEILVNLPFTISFAGVDFVKQSRQEESVKVGLIFGG